MPAVDYVNRALLLLGGETIAALNSTDSPNSASATILYQPTVDELLAEYPWRFATTHQQLTKLVAVPPNSIYKYQYELPANTLRVVNVSIDTGNWQFYKETSTGLRRLYSDETIVWADVIIRPSSDSYPAHFERALVSRLAKALAMPVTRRPDFYSLFSAISDREVSAAKSQDWNEQPWPELADGDLISASRYAN